MELTTSWKEEGIQQGEYRALKRLLTRRFQTIPDDVLARIETAQPEQLGQWLENTLDAITLDDVFRSH